MGLFSKMREQQARIREQEAENERKIQQYAKNVGVSVKEGSNPAPKLEAIRCPHCQSTNVQFMQQDKKAFSVGKAAGGALLTGGVGTLAGFAGKKGKKQWHCQNCGQTFETK